MMSFVAASNKMFNFSFKHQQLKTTKCHVQIAYDIYTMKSLLSGFGLFYFYAKDREELYFANAHYNSLQYVVIRQNSYSVALNYQLEPQRIHQMQRAIKNVVSNVTGSNIHLKLDLLGLEEWHRVAQTAQQTHINLEGY